MAKQFRVTFYCNHCNEEHRFVGELDKVLKAVDGLMTDEDPIKSILIEDEATAQLRDIETADRQIDDPLAEALRGLGLSFVELKRKG